VGFGKGRNRTATTISGGFNNSLEVLKVERNRLYRLWTSASPGQSCPSKTREIPSQVCWKPPRRHPTLTPWESPVPMNADKMSLEDAAPADQSRPSSRFEKDLVNRYLGGTVGLPSDRERTFPLGPPMTDGRRKERFKSTLAKRAKQVLLKMRHFDPEFSAETAGEQPDSMDGGIQRSYHGRQHAAAGNPRGSASGIRTLV